MPAATTSDAQRSGMLLAIATTVIWGTQFPLAKSLFASIDPTTLTAIRWALATLGFVAVLWVVEGRAAVSFDGQFARAALMGFFGLVVGVLVVYIGLPHTTATSAAVVVAAQPFVAAVVLRVRDGTRVSTGTRAAIAVAFVGVVLVITRGHPDSLLDGTLGWGILLVLIGQVGWVLYTIDSVSFPGYSPLRYATMTAVPGAGILVIAAVVAALLGLTHPTWHGVVAHPWRVVYTAVGPAFLAALAWHAARARLGAQSLVLFQNLVPVTTFAIEIARGNHVHTLEIAGAALTIGALSANSLYQRQSTGGLEAVALAAADGI